ncbi:MAG: tRNA dihydrouridine synthase DusB [Clostridia bacterium]|nr:tRNA dihydrouridine synthase DusB [Clostridia bacterium]
MLKIGNITLKHGLMLGPMAGFSDRAMRVICHEAGAEYSVTEMISAKAVVYGDKKTFSLARILSDEGAVALQLFGSEPDIMARAAEVMSRAVEGGVAPVAIDINMGCPVNKVFSNGEGSALMRSPELIEKIVRSVTESIDIPCTVKLRAGVDAEHKNTIECALASESGGAAAVCVHGRTRVEMYSGKADREIIKNVKQALHIPVIANGDICSAADAKDMLAETGADGIMVARGAVGNPFIFSEITAALEGRATTPVSIEERVRVALRQLSLAIEEKGEGVAVREARKQIALFLRAFRGSAALRARINSAESYGDVRAAMADALKNYEPI